MSTTTTSYGSWVNHNNGSTLTIEDSIHQALGDYADDYDLDAIAVEYRAAINAALPEGVTLNGDEFYGPVPPVEVDIAAVLDGVDFWTIVERHDTTAKTEPVAVWGSGPTRSLERFPDDHDAGDVGPQIAKRDAAWAAQAEQPGAETWSCVVLASDPEEVLAAAAGDANVHGAVRVADLPSYTETFDLDQSFALHDLALPVELDEIVANADGSIRGAINEAITAQLREHGVDTTTGEWLGEWSAEKIVRDILARRRVQEEQ